ncbi:MAG: hypothetical protein K0S24_2031 [Sphingobacterium sp.]|jgi:hypothetical protein|nr:hypothetical protein [Sphingobacterium sp.]
MPCPKIMTANCCTLIFQRATYFYLTSMQKLFKGLTFYRD